VSKEKLDYFLESLERERMDEMMPILNTAGVLLWPKEKEERRKSAPVKDFEVWEVIHDDEGQRKSAKKIQEGLSKEQADDLLRSHNLKNPEVSTEIVLKGKTIASLWGDFSE